MVFIRPVPSETRLFVVSAERPELTLEEVKAVLRERHRYRDKYRERERERLCVCVRACVCVCVKAFTYLFVLSLLLPLHLSDPPNGVIFTYFIF